FGHTGAGRRGIGDRGNVDEFASEGRRRPGVCQDEAACHGLIVAACYWFALWPRLVRTLAAGVPVAGGSIDPAQTLDQLRARNAAMVRVSIEGKEQSTVIFDELL